MNSSTYAYLFPPAGGNLDGAEVIGVLEHFGAELGNNARFLVPVDDKGHLGDIGKPAPIQGSRPSALARWLVDGDQFQFDFRLRRGRSPLTIVCGLALGLANAHIYLGWAMGQYRELAEGDQSHHWTMIRGLAAATGAGYVVVVDDASEDFEDRFLEIDGHRVLDTACSHAYGHGIRAVWVRHGAGVTVPDGICIAGNPRRLGNGFVEYLIG